VKQAWIGLIVQEMDEKIAQYLKYPGRKGVMVKAVEPESPAQGAGLREGDVLLAMGNRKIAGHDDYLAASRAAAAGEPLEIQIWRGGRTQTVSLTTREFPIERADQLAWSLLGIKVENLTPKNRKDFRIAVREGVVITEIRSGSQLARIGLRAGDVLRQIDEAGVANQEEFRKALVKSRQKTSLVLLIQRGDQGYYVTVAP
jgi:S1-C subfamily serine protease